MLAFLSSPALADEAPPPADPSGWVTLDVPSDFPSALDTVEPAEADDGARIEDLLPVPLPSPARDRSARIRGRWFGRPRLSALAACGDGGACSDPTIAPTAGLVVGHQWWSLRETTLRPVGETRLTAAFPFGAASGWEVDLAATAGVWLGPVGLLAGPAARGGRIDWGDAPGADLSIGPTARLAARAGPLTPWVGATPAWSLTGGPRSTELNAGAELAGSPFALRLEANRREAGGSPTVEAVAGLHLRLW